VLLVEGARSPKADPARSGELRLSSNRSLRRHEALNVCASHEGLTDILVTDVVMPASEGVHWQSKSAPYTHR
jgi:hypothetical protein